MLRWPTKICRLKILSRLFNSEISTSKISKFEKSRKGALDRSKGELALVEKKSTDYKPKLLFNTPVVGFLAEDLDIEACYQRLKINLSKSEISDADLTFLYSWNNLKNSDVINPNQTNNWVSELINLLKDKSIKKESEFCFKVTTGLIPILITQSEALNKILEALEFKKLPAKAQIRIIDKIIGEIDEQVERADTENLKENILVFAVLQELAFSETIVKDYDGALLKQVSTKLIQRFFLNLECDEIRTYYEPFAKTLSNIVDNKHLKFEQYFETTHIIMFILYFYSKRTFVLDAKYELNNRAIELLARCHDKAVNSGEFKSTLAFIFEEEYNYSDIKSYNNSLKLSDIFNEFKIHLEIVKKFTKKVSNHSDSNFVSLYINSHFACKNNQLSYFIVNEENIAKLAKDYLSAKTIFNYLITTFVSLNSNNQFKQFEHSFSNELKALSPTDTKIINLLLLSKHKSKNAEDDYVKLVIESVAIERLKHKLLMALKTVATDLDSGHSYMRLESIDEFIKNLDGNKELKHTMLYCTDSAEGLLQCIVNFFTLNPNSYYRVLGMDQAHVESERVFEKFYSIGERGETFLDDGRVLSNKLFNEYIKKSLVPQISTYSAHLEENDDQEEDEERFYIEDQELKIQNFNFLDNYLNKELFDIDKRVESGMTKPLDTFKKEALEEQMGVRLSYWVFRHLNFSDVQKRVKFYIKEHKMNSLAEKIAEIGARTKTNSLLKLSLRYLEFSGSKFDSKLTEEAVRSVGYFENGKFYPSNNSELAKKAQIAGKYSFDMNDEKLSDDIRNEFKACLNAKEQLKYAKH